MLIMYVKIHTKPYVRLNRVIRDIPNMYHCGGVSDTNMRQYLENEMKQNGYRCRCIRCREIKTHTYKSEDVSLDTIKYTANNATEYFIQFVLTDKYTLIGFLRLRLDEDAGLSSNNKKVIFPALIDAAMIRELHVYGQLVPTYNNSNKDVQMKVPQHSGYGKRLLEEAFRIAKENNYNKIAVISGDGVKSYYRKFGFEDEGHYMTKLI